MAINPNVWASWKSTVQGVLSFIVIASLAAPEILHAAFPGTAPHWVTPVLSACAIIGGFGKLYVGSISQDADKITVRVSGTNEVAAVPAHPVPNDPKLASSVALNPDVELTGSAPEVKK